jgi:hypothetical protein
MQEDKKIEINGKANRYAIKKLIKEHTMEKETKKRVVSENWKFGNECFIHTYQINILQNINEINNLNPEITEIKEITKIMMQEINKKIYNYKQQDLLKKLYLENKFLTFENVIKKLIESELKCRYCDCEMLVLYDISREMKQWSVDRIDNDLGHNDDNFHIACLECNLKRRRRTDEKFLFTKKLNIIKQEN